MFSNEPVYIYEHWKIGIQTALTWLGLNIEGRIWIIFEIDNAEYYERSILGVKLNGNLYFCI